jgi:hypothetical protein
MGYFTIYRYKNKLYLYNDIFNEEIKKIFLIYCFVGLVGFSMATFAHCLAINA